MTLTLIALIVGICIGWIARTPTKELGTPPGTPHILPPHAALPVIPHVDE